jgi:energy-coupling factor transporter ATP-binding protein EcfA2
MNPLVELKDFSFTYPSRGYRTVRALDSLNISINRGEFILVKGDSGSGKSSLLLSLCGIIPHATGGRIAGRLIIDNRDIREHDPHELSCLAGAAFQNPHNQFFTPTVRDEVAFSLQNRGVPGPEMAIRIKESLEYTGLAGFEDRSPRTLSGGEKQRLLLSILLAWDPPVFLLDEPFSALDPEGAVQLAHLLEKLHREKSKTIILAEKRGEYIESFADRVLYLEEGKTGTDPEFENGQWKKFPLSSLKRTSSEEKKVSLEINDLSFTYPQGRMIFSHDNFTFAGGEITALRGVNGSGKSTLASLIMGVLKPQGGSILLGEDDLGPLSLAKRAQSVGYLLQNPDLQLFAPTVKEEIGFGLKHLSPEERENRIGETLEFFHLEELSDTPPSILGFAMRKRITLACVYARKPLFSLLDEPDWGQDREGLNLIGNYMNETVSRGGGVILITHNDTLASAWQARSIILGGKGK